MSPRIVIYQLQRKFVNQREDIPETARQVLYYTLAVGHHVGVLDCFSSLAEIPLEEFGAWLECLPEGPGKSKLEGVLKWGEIEINCSHVKMLLPLLQNEASYAVAPTPCAAAGPGAATWPALLARCLQDMSREPALYLMMRKRP